MGKGQIISGGTGGLYNVKLIYAYRARVEKKIADAQAQITALQTREAALTAQINAETDPKKQDLLILERSAVKLEITSREKLIGYYQDGMPADPTVSAYCMDLTEDLAGYVGTAEIPGEKVTVVIRPGYDGRATYLASRDGQLMPPIAGEPNQVLFNWMLLPGWQRHKPIYRIGRIVAGSIDRDANTCSVCLDSAYSSQQHLPAVDGLTVGECGADNPVTTQIADFCSRNPGHPLCTNTTAGDEIALTNHQLAQLQEVNSYVNSMYGRLTDKSGFRMGDSWDVMSPGGSGDCVAEYEEIYTSDGIRRVKDLSVGDLALSYDFDKKSFCYKPIIKIWEKGELPGVRVGLKNGHHIDITENHPLWARANQSRGRDGNGLRKYEKIYFKDIDLSKWWKRRLPIATKIPYEVRDIEWLTEGLCKALGHYLAEGWVGKCKVDSSGWDLREHIIPILEAEGIPFSRYVNNSGVPCIRFLKSRFKDYLRTLKSNSFDIHLPEEIFHLPENKLFKIIEGFWIGDGHNGNYPNGKYISRKQEVYSTSSEQFALDLQRIGLQIGRTFHLWKQERHGGTGTKPIYRVTRNDDSYFNRDHGYPGLSEVGIARNRISDIGPVKMRDFEVEGTHTFVFKNGLVSHQCEDFALQKMQRIVSNYGWDPKDLVIVTSYMRDGQGHVSLGVRTSNRGLMLLDVNYDQVGEAARMPYRIDRIGLTKDTWRSYTRRLDAVPIEYMQCNAWAFAEGDSVVVQFTGQDWAQPKVVGFSDDPQPCEMNIWRHGIVGLNFSGAWKYAIYGDVWTQKTDTPHSGTVYYVDAIAFDDSANQWIFGGDNGYLECPNEGFEKNCLRFNTTAEAYVMRADHPAPARQFGQSAWYIGTGSYLIAGLISDTCYIPDPNPEAPPTDVVNEIAVKSANAFFNDALNAWTTKQSLPDAKCNAIDFMLAGKGYIGGGENLTPTIFGDLHSYDPTTDVWTGQQGLPRDVTIGQGASLSGKGYQLLGYCETSSPGDLAGSYNGIAIWQTSQISEYDPIADSWAARSHGPYDGLFNGAVGINGAVWSHDLEVLQEYDPLTDSWAAHTFGVGQAPGWSHNRLAR